jgi:hypothetical protein
LWIIVLNYVVIFNYFQDARVKWEHFLTVTDLHVTGSTGCKRKLSEQISYLTPYHIDSLKNMVQAKGKIIFKYPKILFFYHNYN